MFLSLSFPEEAELESKKNQKTKHDRKVRRKSFRIRLGFQLSGSQTDYQFSGCIEQQGFTNHKVHKIAPVGFVVAHALQVALVLFLT